MSSTTIAVIVVIVLGLMVTIVFLLLWLRGQAALGPPEAMEGSPVLLDIQVTYSKDTRKPITKKNRKEQWASLNSRDYMDKPTQAQAKLFPCKLTVEFEYGNGTKENKVYYAKPEVVNKLGFD